MNITANYIKAKKELSDTINKLAPEIEEYFANTDIKYKADSTPFMKNTVAINKIIAPYRVGNFRIRIRYTSYSKFLVIDTHYKDSEFGVSYIEDYHCIGATPRVREELTHEEYEQSVKRINEIETIMSDLRHEQSRLKLRINK